MKQNIPKTKIVATIGPSSNSPSVLEKLIISGMSVARLNFSHGNRQQHAKIIKLIRKLSAQIGVPIAILQDLSGPKIRVGKVPESGIVLEQGRSFVLTATQGVASQERVSISYEGLPSDLREGDTILLADGLMELRVEWIQGPDIHCRVVRGGVLTSHKGINVPSKSVSIPSLTPKDRKDLLFGLENGVDYVALSFVRQSQDVLELKEMILRHGKQTPVIAKIEKWEAVGAIDQILDTADGIMVARGDLGVEIPLEKVPMIQKEIIRKANLKGKPVITATQMLRSMVDHPIPTRAEATDIANAVLDGTDAVMLSEETASGKYPVESVIQMRKIIKQAEEKFPHNKYLELIPQKTVSESVAHAACVLADHLDTSTIIATTHSGLTAKNISRYRPREGILALSPRKDTVRSLCLYWGCFPRLVMHPKDTDDMFKITAASALETGLVDKGDLVVITAGHPVWVAGTTNMLRVDRL